MGAGAKAVRNAKDLVLRAGLIVQETLKERGTFMAYAPLGYTAWGTPRKLDLLVKTKSKKEFAIECIYQDKTGTAEQKFFAKLYDNKTLPIFRLIVFEGDGFPERFKNIMRAHGAIDLKDLAKWITIYCSTVE